MPDDFRLLLKAIAIQRASWHELITVAAERVSHQRQVEPSALLRLPDVRHLVHPERLLAKRLLREIFGPAAAVGVEPDVTGRGHCRSPRLQWPPFASEQADPRIINRVAENGSSEIHLAGRQRAAAHAVMT